MRNYHKNKCPFCKSKNIAKIMYGMPAFSKKLEKELASGKIILGGCNVSDNAPLFQCNVCGRSWR